MPYLKNIGRVWGKAKVVKMKWQNMEIDAWTEPIRAGTLQKIPEVIALALAGLGLPVRILENNIFKIENTGALVALNHGQIIIEPFSEKAKKRFELNEKIALVLPIMARKGH